MRPEDLEADVGRTLLHAVATGETGPDEIARRVFRIELVHLDYEEATFDVWSHDEDATGFRVQRGVFRHGRHVVDVSGHASRESVHHEVARMSNPGLFERYPAIPDVRESQGPDLSR